MLECKDITVNYQGKTVLDHCNLSIKKGEIVGIMGESGSGKSTLARVILGIEKPTQGQVLLDGKTYSIKEDGVRILVVFQDSFHAVNPRSLSGLDPKTQVQILQLLYKIHGKYQNTFIFIAHDEQLCRAICDRTLILENGQFTRELQDVAEAT